MKAKKMTQQLALLIFSALFIAFMFNACSDVAGPNENLGNEYSQISSAESEQQDLRRRGARTTTAGESVSPPSCTLDPIILGYGDPKTQTGNVTPSFDGNGNLILLIEAIGDWKFSETLVYVGNDPPPGPGQGGPWRNFDSKDHDPMVDSYTWTVSLSGFSENDTIYVAVKGQSHLEGEQNGNGQTATAGDEGPWHASHFTYFILTYSCPANALSFNGAG